MHSSDSRVFGHMCRGAPLAVVASHKHTPRIETHILEKTKMCKFYFKGRCTRGEACTFAHKEEEVLPKPDFFRTQLCADLFQGRLCQAGSECSFAHSRDEIRRIKTEGKRNARTDARFDSDQHRLEMMEQQLMFLQAQLQALHAMGASSGLASERETDQELAPPDTNVKRPGVPPRDTPRVGGEDGPVSAFGSSRQSTECTDISGHDFSRKMSFDAWEDMTPGVGASEISLDTPRTELSPRSLGQQPEEEVPCELVVKRTFVTLERLDTLDVRRTRSSS